VLEDPGDERLAHVGQLQWIVRAVEGVDVTLEQAHVGVHGRAGVLPERLGHERRPGTVLERDFLDDVAERHHVVGHGQRVGEAQVDLLLAGRPFVVAEFHRDAHEFQRLDGVPAEVRRGVVHCLVEVAGVVHRDGLGAVIGAGFEQEELDFGVDVAGEAEVVGLLQLAPQHVPRVSPRR
jgi:hypothetical protein